MNNYDVLVYVRCGLAGTRRMYSVRRTTTRTTSMLSMPTHLKVKYLSFWMIYYTVSIDFWPETGDVHICLCSKALPWDPYTYRGARVTRWSPRFGLVPA